MSSVGIRKEPFTSHNMFWRDHGIMGNLKYHPSALNPPLNLVTATFGGRNEGVRFVDSPPANYRFVGGTSYYAPPSNQILKRCVGLLLVE